ncbi:MAG: DUF4340 domain-containing protein [Spirochaetia bacterium]|nr:DUF4340 domain-containing protein [Spirochaetia bacterium]
MKKNLILLAILLVVGAVLWYAVQHRPSKKKPLPINRIFSFTEEDAAKWEIVWDGKRILAEKKSGRWEVTEPLRFPTDQNSVIANVKNFNTCDYVEEIGTTNEDLKKWGLDRPSNRYTIWIREGILLTEHTIHQGRELDKPNGFYLRYNQSSNVFFVEDWVVRALQKTTGDLRQKDFLAVEPEKIREIRFRDIQIQKVGLFWSVNGRAKEKVQLKHADEAAQKLGFVKADYVYTRQEQPELFSAEPFARIYLRWEAQGGREKEDTLSVLRRDDKLFVRTSQGDLIYRVSPEFISTWTNTLSYFLR